MKHEKLFNKDGFYRFIVTTNALTHQHAIETGTAILGDLLKSIESDRLIRVLDLACGGEPITISEIIGSFPERRFDYLGIDINPDQVALAETEFGFADNVVRKMFVEANAWGLDGVANGKYDPVFSGLNFHHATPEELYFLAEQLRERLTKNAIILNHDLYRPNAFGYLRRPDVNPLDPGESFRLVEPEALAKKPIPVFGFEEMTEEWREDLIHRYHQHFIELHADPCGLEQNRAHMWARDFPVSTDELRVVFDKAGFKVEARDFSDRGHPIGNYVALVVATVKDGKA